MSRTVRATIRGSTIRNIAAALHTPTETQPTASMARRAVIRWRTVKRMRARIRGNEETGNKLAIETAAPPAIETVLQRAIEIVAQRVIETEVPLGIGLSRLPAARR